MEEDVFTLQSGAEAEQWNGGHQQNLPLAENKNPASMLNKGHGI